MHTVEYAAALVYEVREGTTSGDPMIRMRFKNGTNDVFQTYNMFGQSGDIPLSLFKSELEFAAINTTADWCIACANSQVRGCATCDNQALAQAAAAEMAELAPIIVGIGDRQRVHYAACAAATLLVYELRALPPFHIALTPANTGRSPELRRRGAACRAYESSSVHLFSPSKSATPRVCFECPRVKLRPEYVLVALTVFRGACMLGERRRLLGNAINGVTDIA